MFKEFCNEFFLGLGNGEVYNGGGQGLDQGVGVTRSKGRRLWSQGEIIIEERE